MCCTDRLRVQYQWVEVESLAIATSLTKDMDIAHDEPSGPDAILVTKLQDINRLL